MKKKKQRSLRSQAKYYDGMLKLLLLLLFKRLLKINRL